MNSNDAVLKAVNYSFHSSTLHGPLGVSGKHEKIAKLIPRWRAMNPNDAALKAMNHSSNTPQVHSINYTTLH